MQNTARKRRPIGIAADYQAWIEEQIALLRARDYAGLDVANLIEELGDLGSSHKDEIESRLLVLLSHLLKWQYQPSGRGNSWRATIEEQRSRIGKRMRQSPSLRSYPHEVIAEEYRLARLRAAGEAGLAEPEFPIDCPYSIEQVLDRTFWPEA